MCELTRIKDTLDLSIANIVANKENFVKDSKKDFSRSSKLTFEKMIRILLQMGGQSLYKELSSYFACDVSMPTPSAFCQQRSKIKFEAFRELFLDFTKSCSGPKHFKGYRVLAIDGSHLYIPRDKNDSETYIFNGENKNGWNRLHLNALYDVLNHVYVDALITPGKKADERRTLLKMLNILPNREESIIVADRGYESYELIYQLITQHIPFLLRVKKPESFNSILNKAKLPETEEFDIDFSFKVASQKRYSKGHSKLQAENEGYKLIAGSSFSFFNDETKKYIFPTLRIVKIDISGDEKEYLITNLSAEQFSKEDIKYLYGMRWGIETAFRELKYNFSLLQFHSKKAEHIKQEIYAKLTVYNFCRMITENLEPQIDTGKKHSRKINFSQAVVYCKYFFLALMEPLQLKELILRTTIPVRPDRSYQRKIIKKQHKSFQYRIA